MNDTILTPDEEQILEILHYYGSASVESLQWEIYGTKNPGLQNIVEEALASLEHRGLVERPRGRGHIFQATLPTKVQES